MSERDAWPVKAQQHQLRILAGYFSIDGSSAVASPIPAAGSNVTISKPAGTGIYRAALADSYGDILYANAVIVKAAGTFDGDIQPVTITKTAGAQLVEFQVRKSSDGTALNPTSVTVMYEIIVQNTTAVP